ncbi:Uncharacterised protein [uncultured archaeon]|nr:Uncharacterised protein [uncultured archaeon]
MIYNGLWPVAFPSESEYGHSFKSIRMASYVAVTTSIWFAPFLIS